jgi:hypothetical protein
MWKAVERLKSYSWGKIFGNSPIGPLKRVQNFFDDPWASAFRAESIGVLQVRIGRTGEKLFNSVFWLEIRFGGVFPQKVTPRPKFLSFC